MSKIKNLIETSNLESTSDIIRYISIIKDEIYKIVNGFIEFDSNFKSTTADVVFSTANFEFAVPHNLNRMPIGYLVGKSSVATSIYDGTTTNTVDFLYVKSSVIANVKLIVF